jgi:hypothetical protein
VPSIGSQFTAAAASLWAMSRWHPCPVLRARNSAAVAAIAPHSGPVFVPMLVWSAR